MPSPSAATVLIVDDEKPIRQWFEFVIGQYREEFAIVGLSSNGAEALHMYEQYKPDIIITDIRMPVMNGLELIQQVKERGGNSLFLILSNYDDFQYVKKGFVSGAKDYLLKAETDDTEIIEALRNIRQAQSKPLLEPEPPAISGMKDTWIRDVLNGHSAGREQLKAAAASVASSIVSRHKYMLLCSINPSARLAAGQPEHKSGSDRMPSYPARGSAQGAEAADSASLWMDTLLEQLKQRFPEIVGVRLDEREYIVLFGTEYPPGEMREIIHQSGKAINERLLNLHSASVSFGLSSRFVSWEQMKVKFTEAKQALEGAFYTGPGKLHVFEERKADNRIGDRYRHKLHELVRSFNMVDGSIVRQADDFIADMLQEAKQGLPAEEAKNIIVHMLDMLHHKLMAIAGPAASAGSLPEPDTALLHRHGECAGFYRQAAVDQLTRLVEAASRQMYGYSEATNKIVHYLHEQYPNRIEMSQLAQLVHLNENYISQLFKKETGYSVTQYVLTIRMKRAKQLLLESRLKINEIAPLVGYASESHFCTAFKLYYGKSPKKFSDHLRILQ